MIIADKSYTGIGNIADLLDKLDFKNFKIGAVQDIAATDTTGKSQSNKPPLDPPKEVPNYEILLSTIMSKIAETLKNNAIDQMNKNQELEKVKFEKKMEELQEWLEESRKAKKWGLFGKVMSYVASALAIVGGALLVATGVGAGLGAALIVGGVIGITDQILKDTGVLEGGFAGLLTDFFIDVCGCDEETAQWLGMAAYIVLLIAASGTAGLAAGAKAGATAGAQAASKFASYAPTAITTTTTVAGLTGAAGNLGAGLTESSSLKHLASAKEIAAMIQEISKTLQMRKEDLEEAMEYYLNAVGRITNMMSSKHEVAQEMISITTKA